MQPADIDVWLGLDVGKSSHHACALDHDGNTILDTPVDQDEKQLRRTIAKLQRRGTVLVIVDQPNTIGSLPLTVARDMGARTAYLPGGAMRKAAQLLPGGSKTDRRDARVIASTAPRMPETLRDCEPDDETMAALRLLSGWDEDTAHELTRTVNRLRGLLLHLHTALERALAGDRIKSDTALGLLEHYKRPRRAAPGGRGAYPRIRAKARAQGHGDHRRGRRRHRRADRHPPVRHACGGIPHLLTRLRYQKTARQAHGHLPAGRGTARRRPTSHDPDQHAGDSGQDRKPDTPRHRRRHQPVQRRRPPRRIRGHRARHPPVRHIHPRGTPHKRREQTPEERMFQTAFVAIRLDPESRAYYDRKRAKGKRHNAAVICLARRRCNVIYSMLRNGTLYQPGGIHTTTNRPPPRTRPQTTTRHNTPHTRHT